AGNLLIPVDWSGVLVRRAEVPVARLLRASTVLEAFSGVLGTLRVPGPEFLESFSPEGRSLPPLFEQQVDLGAGRDVFRLFGSADAPYTVLRVNRRGVRGRCSGGGRACGADFECPVGEACARFLACDGGPNDRRPCTGTADSVAECAAGEGGADGICAPSTCTACDAGPRAGLPCHSRADCAAGGAPTA